MIFLLSTKYVTPETTVKTAVIQSIIFDTLSSVNQPVLAKTLNDASISARSMMIIVNTIWLTVFALPQ